MVMLKYKFENELTYPSSPSDIKLSPLKFHLTFLKLDKKSSERWDTRISDQKPFLPARRALSHFLAIL